MNGNEAPTHVYAGVARWSNGGSQCGVYRRKGENGAWEHLTNGLPADAYVHAITIHPDHPEIVFAAARQGAFRSKDRGDSWTKLDIPEDVQVWAIKVDPKNPKIVYAGTSPIGLFKSEDGGDSWRKMPAPTVKERVKMEFPCRILRLETDPNRSGVLYAAVEANGVMRSNDGGETWEDCNDTLARFADQPKYKSKIVGDTEIEGMMDAHALIVSPADPDTVMVAVRMGLFRSADRGQSWEDMGIGRFSPLTYGRDIRVSPQDPKTLYTCLSPASRSTDGSIYRSRDLGESWERFDRGIKPNSTMMAVALHPRDPDQVYGVSRFGQVFGTRDGGKSWTESQLPDGCKDVYALACA